MSILKTDTNKILSTNSNKIRVGIKKLTELSSNVVTWFNASDINQTIGSSVNSLTGREGKDSATTPYSNIYTLELDAQGYKCLKTTAALASFSTSAIVTSTNSETFIGVVNVKGNYGNVSPYHDGISIALSITGLSYANYTVGSSRIGIPLIQNQKVIITGVMTPTKMYVYSGLTLIATLDSPVNIAPPRTGIAGVFRGDRNNSNVEINYYAAARIQEALTGEKLKQAIRSIAFENGVKI